MPAVSHDGVLERRGDIGLNLDGLYDREKATQYREAQREARQRALEDAAEPHKALLVDIDGQAAAEKARRHKEHLALRARSRSGEAKARRREADIAASRTPEARERDRQRTREAHAALQAAVDGPRTFLP